MSGPSQALRRPLVGVRERRRRQVSLRAAIGRQIVELRDEAGVSQAALARAAGIDQGHLSRIERGLAAASLEVLSSIAACLGADVSVRLFPVAGPRIRDHLQAPMVEALLRRLAPRWAPTVELPVPAARGVNDVALALKGRGIGIACEAHSDLRAIDLSLRRLLDKTLALADVRGFGPVTSSLLLLRSTARMRELVGRHHATFAAAFPGRSRQAMAALTGETAEWPGSTLVWVRAGLGMTELLDVPPRGIRVGR